MENTHVRHVDLSSNGLNEYGATQMAEVLRTSKSLRTLSLDGGPLIPPFPSSTPILKTAAKTHTSSPTTSCTPRVPVAMAALPPGP